jgi:hypothetical protein
MALHYGADEPRILAFETVVPAPTIASYDLNKVMEAARGWQEKAAAAPDPEASEEYRRSAAQFERLVTRSLDTPPIC